MAQDAFNLLNIGGFAMTLEQLAKDASDWEALDLRCEFGKDCKHAKYKVFADPHYWDLCEAHFEEWKVLYDNRVMMMNWLT